MEMGNGRSTFVTGDKNFAGLQDVCGDDRYKVSNERPCY